MKFVLALLVSLVCTQASKFPPNFKKCSRKDPNIDKCFLEAAQIGVNQATKYYSQIGLASFAPLEISELKIGAGSQSVVNVEQNFKNCKLYGISEAKVDEFGFDFEGKFAHGKGLIPEIKMLCDYELNGKILLLPIVGSGSSTIILRNIKVVVRFDYEEEPKNGKTYFKFVSNKLSLEPDFVSFDFENLFNGDKQLGDNVNKVLNENSNEVFADVRSGYEKGLGLVLQHIINNMFSKVSEEEAFD